MVGEWEQIDKKIKENEYIYIYIGSILGSENSFLFFQNFLVVPP